MEWMTNYQLKWDRYWPEVEQYFNSLPPHLRQQGMLLKNNMATFYADTGQFKDILRRDYDYPLFYLPFWLLDDFNFPDNAARENLEKHLFLASVFSFAAAYTLTSILDEDSLFDKRYMFLQQSLAQQAACYLAQLFPEASSFWPYYRAFWADYAEAMLWEFQEHVGQATQFNQEELLQNSGKLAPAKIPVAAVIIEAGQEAILPDCLAMMDQLNLVFQLRQDIFAIRRDLQRGNYTYPIVKTMQEAGMALQQPPVPERILGALVLTDSIGKICRECLARLETGRAISKALNLPTLTAYFTVVENLIDEIIELFSFKTVKRGPATEKKRPRAFFAPPVDTLSKVIEMAEGYLLSDLTFRDSWEVQRRGVFNLPELIGKAFPSGLIVEILCRHGHELSAQVDEVFKTLQETGFRYYEHPNIPPDADDIGLLLRLYPYSSRPEVHRNFLQTPLRWLVENMQPSGEIPVWFLKSDYAMVKTRSVSLWGQNCATVEANLLLGLIDYDWAGYQDLIKKSVANWLDQFIINGLGATRHYIPLYALWTAAELMTKFSARSPGQLWQNKLDLAFEAWLKRLEIETERRKITPQEAAFLTLASLSPKATCPATRPAKSFFKPAWPTILFKSQRYDGSWPAEALFGTPTRGEVATWYASNSVTTAFCYHALKTYARWS